MNRRSFLFGLTAFAAPAIIRTPGLLMPIKALAVGDGVALNSMTHPWLGDLKYVFGPDGRLRSFGVWDGYAFRSPDSLIADLRAGTLRSLAITKRTWCSVESLTALKPLEAA